MTPISPETALPTPGLVWVCTLGFVRVRRSYEGKWLGGRDDLLAIREKEESVRLPRWRKYRKLVRVDRSGQRKTAGSDSVRDSRSLAWSIR